MYDHVCQYISIIGFPSENEQSCTKLSCKVATQLAKLRLWNNVYTNQPFIYK